MSESTRRINVFGASGWPDPGPIRVSVIAENRIYLVTMLEATADDTDVRSYSNPTAMAEMVNVLGDYWNA